jgi:rubrerythrin
MSATTRRGVTRRGLLGAGALLAIGAGPARAGGAKPGVTAPAAVQALIRREDAAAAAYEIVAAATGDALLERIARQDGQHAHVLRVLLESLTVAPGHRPAHPERNDPAALRLAARRSGPAALEAAIALEQELQQAYVDAARALQDAGPLETVATILGSHAQQLAVLRHAAGRPPLDEPVLSPG